MTTPEDRARWKAYLQTYHYLGYQHPFGAHLGYLIVSEPRQQELGGFVFAASAAWALAPRDQWIGWDKKQRQKLLSLILSNDRFLLFPWVTVPNLASHALALATTHIADDWGCRHGYRPVLLETFVDSDLNGADLHTPPLESTEHDPSTGSTPRIQPNFKNCIHILQRSLEELLLLTTEMQTAVQRAFDAIVCQYQKVRPGRSYPRQSFKPDFRWRPAKEKRKRRKKELAPAATA